LPAGDSLFIAIGRGNTISRLRMSDGNTFWERKVEGGGASSLIAVVGNRLWLKTMEHEIVAVDVDKGEETARFRVPILKIPEGVVDEDGFFHVCAGRHYWVLNLRDRGRLLLDGPIEYREHKPSIVYGSSALYTRDRRLIYRDWHGGIFAARVGAITPATVLRPPAADREFGLIGMAAAHGLLYVLTRQHELVALAP
jgi:hypothetical protein